MLKEEKIKGKQKKRKTPQNPQHPNKQIRKLEITQRNLWVCTGCELRAQIRLWLVGFAAKTEQFGTTTEISALQKDNNTFGLV